jgi:hypothetical protein
LLSETDWITELIENIQNRLDKFNKANVKKRCQIPTPNTKDNTIKNLTTSLGLNMSNSKSDISSTNYTNSTLSAEGGTIKINSISAAFDSTSNLAVKNNAGTKLSGANLLAQDIVLNTVGNLTAESLQNSYNLKSKSFGLNLGAEIRCQTPTP